jgi:hypothetical protein
MAFAASPPSRTSWVPLRKPDISAGRSSMQTSSFRSKDTPYAPTSFLAAKSARPFVGGPVLLRGLSPVAYHRVHYPDDGTTLRTITSGDAFGPCSGKRCKPRPRSCLSMSVRLISSRRDFREARVCGNWGDDGWASFRSIGWMSRSGAVKRKHYSISADPRPSCLANPADGGQRTTSSSKPAEA